LVIAVDPTLERRLHVLSPLFLGGCCSVADAPLEAVALCSIDDITQEQNARRAPKISYFRAMPAGEERSSRAVGQSAPGLQ
jgi:hypothetical protein